MPPLPALLERLREIRLDDDASGREIYDATKTLMTMRNVIDFMISTHAAAMDRLKVAGPGGKTRVLLMEMGAAPATATRWLQIGMAMATLQRLPGYVEDGVFSSEHTSAMVSGLAHIEKRSAERLSNDERLDHERALIDRVCRGPHRERSRWPHAVEQTSTCERMVASPQPKTEPSTLSRSHRTVRGAPRFVATWMWCSPKS